MTFQSLISTRGMGTHLLDFLPLADRRRIAASWRTCFGFLPEAPELQKWVHRNAQRYAAEQVAAVSLAAFQSDAALAEKAAGQLYVIVGKVVADMHRATEDLWEDKCASGKHATIVSMLRTLDRFNKHDHSLALHALALSGPCPAVAFPRVSRLIARVWANIGQLRVLPGTEMMLQRVWSIECTCSCVSMHRLWTRQMMQYFDGVWDDWALGANGFNVIYHPSPMFSVYATDLTDYVDLQVVCMSDMAEMFTSD